MSFLIVGNDLSSLLLSDNLVKNGWKLTLITKDNLISLNEFGLIGKQDLVKLGLDNEYVVRNINKINVFFDDKKINTIRVNTSIINLSKYKFSIMNNIKKKATLFDESTFMDQNGENTFISVANKGNLIKCKYVINFEDIDPNYRKDFIYHKEYLLDTYKMDLGIEKFLDRISIRDKGYTLFLKIDDKKSILIDKSLNDTFNGHSYLKNLGIPTDTLKEIRIKKIPKYGISKLRENNIFYAGVRAGIVNNLSLDSFLEGITFSNKVSEYFNFLMKGKDLDYNNYFNKISIKEYVKKGSIFWNSNSLDKLKMLEYFYGMDSINDFDSIFRNAPFFSKCRLKLYF